MAEVIEFNAKEDKTYILDYIPLEKWDAYAWELFWNDYIVPLSETTKFDKWQLFAEFMQTILETEVRDE